MSKAQTDHPQAMHQPSQALLKRKTQKELWQEKDGAISKQAKEAEHLEREAQAQQRRNGSGK